MSKLDASGTIKAYKNTMKQCMKLYLPEIDSCEMDKILDFSIKKRYKKHNATIDNSYTKKQANMTLLEISDYIMSREPIATAHGTLFRKHGEVPNPMAKVIQSFMDLRDIHKGQMKQYPKGSEYFEKYNLAQQLDKIDNNGIRNILISYFSAAFSSKGLIETC